MKKSILIIEDDPVILKLMKTVVECMGFQASVCSNGLEAKKIVENEKFDLLICDLMMPQMDGIRFVEWLRKDMKNNIPLMICSSVKNEDKLEKVKSFGIDEFLTKPFEMDVLMGKVKELTS